jgi:hypothetical protein
VALLFAAAAIEAFINELAALAKMWPSAADPPACTFAVLYDAVEGVRGRTRDKFAVAGVAFTGTDFNSGNPPFQGMKILFEIRDSSLHLKPAVLEFDSAGRAVCEERIMARAHGFNILAEHDASAYVNAARAWISLLSTRAAARWACDVSADVVSAVLDSIPQSKLRTEAESLYRANFSRQ